MKKTILLLALFMTVFACGYASASEKFTPAGSKQGPEIFVQLGYLDSVHSVVFSPDGKYYTGKYGLDFVEKINKLGRNLCLV